MFTLTSMPSPSSAFAAYASTSASIVLVKTMFNQFVPPQFQQFVISKVRSYFKPRSPLITFLIEEKSGMTHNVIYDDAELYLCTKVIPNAERLKISKSPKQNDLTIKFAQCEKIADSFEGIDLIWRFVQEEPQSAVTDKNGFRPLEKRLFELSFDKQFKDRVLDSYLPFVINRAKAIRAEKRVVKLHTLGRNSGGAWDSINLEHPSNFRTLAIDPDLKKRIIDDLDSFVERKEFYKRVGKVWKRGYLLYGPPGTGKSSLIAAMANYLKFDVYDLQLMSLSCDSDLRRLLLATSNRSILVIEDIDCSVVLPDRQMPGSKRDVQFTLSGLLNFIDGLWSSCGDERIIIFTTNNKEKLDPALLRPGRMDLHINMTYCTNHGFKVLASNYLGINDRHWLFGQIEDLIGQTKVTPAEIAEELMKSNDADVSLRGLVKFLKRKRIESLESKSEGTEEVEVNKGKRQKIVECEDKVVANGVLLE